MIGLIAPESAERADLAAQLGERGQEIVVSDPSAASMQTLVLSQGIEAIVFDLAAADALKLIRRHAAQWKRVPLICLADRRRPNATSDALRLGAADIVARPLRVADVRTALSNAAQLAGLPPDDVPEKPQRAEEERPDGLFGISPSMQDVMALVQRIAPSGCNVIVIGERGTGRERVARAIHTRSPRRDGPFVKIAAGAAEPGDFAPLFDTAAARETTIYLENVNELRTAAQEALELWLRPRGERRAAASESEHVRVIAGATPGLFDMAEQQLISRELIEALAVVRIDLAPLRQRPEDVQMLAVHFLKEACREAKVPAKTFTRGALQLLRALPWRGNASELKSLCERLTVIVQRGVVQLEDVLGNVALDAPEGVRRRETLRQARERFERDYIAAVVQENHGRIGDAARQLGMERTNLYRKLKQLHMAGTGPRE